MSDIGTWNDVFEAVGLLCIIGSALITTYTTNSLDRYFDGNKEIALLVIIAAEHVVLGLRYLMSKIVSTVPGWLSRQIRYREMVKKNEDYVKSIVKQTAANFMNFMSFGAFSSPQQVVEPQQNKKQIVDLFANLGNASKKSEKSLNQVSEIQSLAKKSESVEKVDQGSQKAPLNPLLIAITPITPIKPQTPEKVKPQGYSLHEIFAKGEQQEPIQPSNLNKRSKTKQLEMQEAEDEIPLIKTHHTKVSWPDTNNFSFTLKQLGSSLQSHISEVGEFDPEGLIEIMKNDKGFYSKQADMIKNSIRKIEQQKVSSTGSFQKTRENFETRFGPEIRQIEQEIKSYKEPLNPSQVGRILRLKDRLSEVERKRLEVKYQIDDQEYQNVAFETALAMAQVFAGVFYYLMKKAWDESLQFFRSKEGKSLEKIAVLQKSSNSADKQQIQGIISELSASRIQLFNLLSEYKIEAEVKAMGLMTGSRERGQLSREGEVMLRRNFLPALDVNVSDFFRDLCDSTDSDGLGAMMAMEGGDTIVSFGQVFDQDATTFDQSDEDDYDNPFIEQDEREFKNDEEALLDDIMNDDD